jgi:hypothetical protein
LRWMSLDVDMQMVIVPLPACGIRRRWSSIIGWLGRC